MVVYQRTTWDVLFFLLTVKNSKVFVSAANLRLVGHADAVAGCAMYAFRASVMSFFAKEGLVRWEDLIISKRQLMQDGDWELGQDSTFGWLSPHDEQRCTALHLMAE